MFQRSLDNLGSLDLWTTSEKSGTNQIKSSLTKYSYCLSRLRPWHSMGYFTLGLQINVSQACTQVKMLMAIFVGWFSWVVRAIRVPNDRVGYGPQRHDRVQWWVELFTLETHLGPTACPTEFAGLWKYISDWQNVFKHFDQGEWFSCLNILVLYKPLHRWIRLDRWSWAGECSCGEYRRADKRWTAEPKLILPYASNQPPLSWSTMGSLAC